MRIVRIPKKKGFRTIYVPNKEEKRELRNLVGQVNKKAEKLCPDGVAHGFMRFKSPVTNALSHVGHEYTTVFDLKDFFDSVNLTHLKGKLKQEELDKVLVDGSPRQGLPTSPTVANIAASDMDRAILKWRDDKKLQFVYTRYADDLSFSYDDPEITNLLKVNIPQIVGRCGFKINKNKTRTLSAKNGRRMITGVAVDNELHIPRRIKRKLRAAIHQGNKNIIQGLTEWTKLKLPTKNEKLILSEDDIVNLCTLWKLPKVNTRKLPDKSPNEDLGNDCFVSNDPAYMLGMSKYTTGWTSCMNASDGAYRRGVIFWLYLKGTRVAMYLSDKTKIFAGVERMVMRARCLVHELRNGVKVFDRIYPGNEDSNFLKERLLANGYISIYDAQKLYPREKVVGHVPSKRKPYMDNLRSSEAKASEGQWKGTKVRVVFI